MSKRVPRHTKQDLTLVVWMRAEKPLWRSPLLSTCAHDMSDSLVLIVCGNVNTIFKKL